MYSAEELVFKFKAHLQVLNRSPSTIEAYTTNTNFFLDAMTVDDIKQITTSMIETYIAGLYAHKTDDGRPYKTSTICVKVRSLKRFLEYLEKANIIFINPAETIKEPKLEQRLPKDILSSKEANNILDQPNLSTRIGIRDRTVLEVLYSTGIRREEVCNLTIYDADLTGGMLRINKGKGKKDRVVPLGKHAVRFLREYITKVRPHFTKKNRSNRKLFVDRYGKALSSQMVGIIVKTYAKAAKIKKRVSPHTFRHTFATTLIKNNADIRAVQKMMGHEDLRTTQEYTRRLISNVKAVHKKTHPRERDKQDRKSIKPKLERIKAKNEPE